MTTITLEQNGVEHTIKTEEDLPIAHILKLIEQAQADRKQEEKATMQANYDYLNTITVKNQPEPEPSPVTDEKKETRLTGVFKDLMDKLGKEQAEGKPIEATSFYEWWTKQKKAETTRTAPITFHYPYHSIIPPNPFQPPYKRTCDVLGQKNVTSTGLSGVFTNAQ